MDKYLEQIKNNELKNIPQEPSLDSGAIEVLKEILGAEFAVFEHECGHLSEAFKKGGKGEISMMPLQKSRAHNGRTEQTSYLIKYMLRATHPTQDK